MTMGDACGIGPGDRRAAFRVARSRHGCVVVGDVDAMRRAARAVRPRHAGAAPGSIARRRGRRAAPHCVPVLQPPACRPTLRELPLGRGRCARRRAAVALHRGRGAPGAAAATRSAIVTAPIHKEALAAAGVAVSRATPRCCRRSRRAGALPPVRMMLANDELRVVLVTIHVSLRARHRGGRRSSRARDDPHRARGGAALRASRAPRIAVAGLEPACRRGRPVRRRGDAHHRAGDRGGARRGHRRAAARSRPTRCSCARATRRPPGEFDVVVAMTHDHGLIPVKYLGVEHGVNVTLGLPFVRTSPDHGTAFDIAGRGVRRSGEPAWRRCGWRASWRGGLRLAR